VNYNLVYTHRAERDIKKLDSSIKNRIGNALLKLRDNPLLYSEKLSDPALGTYKFRMGDYRVIFDI
jgi:mRNA interferase RelE/StbE